LHDAAIDLCPSSVRQLTAAITTEQRTLSSECAFGSGL
jgi:hypothetical protein